MQCVTRPRITELNPHLLCVLCGGYYIDATAIIECLHSFCKSCIIRYLETRKYCPICDVLVHKTKPLQNLRPDTVLQSIVYKLVPNLYEKEMRNRRCYYSKVPTSHHPQTAEEKGVITESSKFYSNSDSIDFSLEYVNYSECNFYVATNSQRYFRCQACVTIEQLRKLIEAKYSTTDEHQTRFFYNEIQLPEHLTLLDLAYMSAWKRRGFIRILYEIQVKKILIESNLKSTSSSSTTVVESVEEIPPSIPVTSSSSSSSSCPPDSSAIENDSTKTETSSEPPSSDVVAVPKPTKESSPTPAASTVAAATSTVATATAAIVTTTTTCASTASAVPDEKEIAITSSSVSTIASSSSNLSLTVTCSMNSDDITTSSVGAPITTSVCLPSVNGMSPSPPKVATPAPSPRATTTTERVEPKQKSQPEIPAAAAAAEESPKTAKNSAAAVVVVEKVKPPTPPTSSTPSKKPEVTKEKSRPPVPSAVKRPLEESEKSTPQKPVAETSPKPAKIPKLSGLAEKVLSANKSPSGLTIEVRKSASVAPTTSATKTAVSSTPTPSLTVTSVSVSVPKASVTVSPVSRVDAVQKCSPRSIYNRVEAPPPTQPPPAITKSSTKIIKSFNRPWNSTSSHQQQQQQQRPAIPDLIDVSTGQAVKSTTTKIIKARPTTAPRYQPSSSSSNRSVYESPSVPPLTTPTSKSTIVDPDAKKTAVASSKMFPVMKIDPQTLSPILAAVAAATATSSTSTTIASISPSISSASKKSSYSPFLPPSVTAAAAASELYTNSGPFPSSGGGGLSTYTSPNLTTKPPGSYVMPNSLLPINQFMYEMYGNGTRTLEYMKAMTTNICQSSLFHPSLLPPSMGPSASFYNSMQKYEKKYEKKSSSSSSSSPRLPKGPPSSTTNQQRQQQQQSPPSVQRIPPSNNNTKLAISEHSSGEKKPVPTAVDKHESVSNGQLKHKTKKTDASGGGGVSGGGGSSFSINNLIPLEIEKRATSGVSHTCSADGVHQVCDQMPSTTTKNKLTTDSKETTETNKRTAAAESKLNNTTSKKESEERK